MPIFTLYHYAYFQKLCTYTKYNHTELVDYDKNQKKCLCYETIFQDSGQLLIECLTS